MKEHKTCKICLKTFTRRNYMLKHMENSHSKRFACPKCFRFFSEPTEHSCAVENGRYSCYVNNCPLKFSNGMAMRLHIRDCHRKVDEGIVDNIKTKKGIRQLIKALCTKINLLSTCFDELKYQVDTIADFLGNSDMGFKEGQTISKPATTRKRKASSNSNVISEEEREVDNDDDDDEAEEEGEEEEIEDIEYIEEIESIEQMPNELDDCEKYDSDLAEFLKDDDDPKKNSTSHSDETIVEEIRTTSNPTVILNKSFLTSSTPIINTQNLQTSPIFLNRPVRIIPIKNEIFNTKNITKVGSTIITQIPATRLQNQTKTDVTPIAISRAIPIFSQSKTTTTTTQQFVSKTATTSSESPIPSLFLSIQYDPQTTVCEDNDPKITFHFDTKPPEKQKTNAKNSLSLKRQKFSNQ